jgi:copper chaperone CopZ
MTSTLTIAGMIAVHSKRAVFTALAGVPGVHSAEVELGRAVVDHDETATREAIATAIEAVGCTLVDMAPEVSRRSLPLLETRDGA